MQIREIRSGQSLAEVLRARLKFTSIRKVIGNIGIGQLGRQPPFVGIVVWMWCWIKQDKLDMQW